MTTTKMPVKFDRARFAWMSQSSIPKFALWFGQFGSFRPGEKLQNWKCFYLSVAYEVAYHGASPMCTIERLEPGTAYQVRVNCEGPGGLSDYSEPALLATEPVCPGQCSMPRLHGKPKPHSIPIKWSKYKIWSFSDHFCLKMGHFVTSNVTTMCPYGIQIKQGINLSSMPPTRDRLKIFEVRPNSFFQPIFDQLNHLINFYWYC